jgi:hypothetical protein
MNLVVIFVVALVEFLGLYSLSGCPPNRGNFTTLDALALNPSDETSRRAVARHAAGSLWSLVRDDPSYLVRWGDDAIAGAGQSPFATLCSLLSEPVDGLPETGTLRDVILDRCGQGVWKDRKDCGDLLLQMSLPGTISAQLARSMLQAGHDIDSEVVSAFDRVTHHREQPVGRLARDIVLLRVAAGRHERYSSGTRTLELATELPFLLDRVVQQLDQEDTGPPTGASPPSTSPLGDHEAGLLRLCLRVVARVSGNSTLRTQLWLGWRLYGWLFVQLEAIRRDRGPEKLAAALERLNPAVPPPREEMTEQVDCLDPFGFQARTFNHRLAAVLNALTLGQRFSDMEHSDELPGFSAEALKERLVAIADRFANAGPSRDALDWGAASNVPDLAVSALLALNPRTFSEVTQETRRRVLERVVKDLDSASEAERRFGVTVLIGYARALASVGEEERAGLELILDTLRGVPKDLLWILRVSLYGAGHKHLRGALEAQLLKEAQQVERVSMAELLLLVEPGGELLARVTSLVSACTERSVSPVFLVIALGRVAAEGTADQQQVARELLAQVSTEDWIQEEPEACRVLTSLGIERRPQ